MRLHARDEDPADVRGQHLTNTLTASFYQLNASESAWLCYENLQQNGIWWGKVSPGAVHISNAILSSIPVPKVTTTTLAALSSLYLSDWVH